MTHVNSIFSRCIISYLEMSEEVPDCIEKMIAKSVTSLLDSEIIIEDSFNDMEALKPPQVELPLESFEQTQFIDQLTEQIKTQGFGQDFHQIIGLFGSIMIGLCASDEQQKLVEQWVDDGYFGHFMMTDAGGSALSSWNSILTAQQENQFKLSVDKKWVIEGHNLGFCMIVCQQKGRPYPTTVLLSPEQAKDLDAQTCGLPFLDGKLQLGDVKGELEVSKSSFLFKGGLGSVNRFLTLVRPRFVKALMHHLLWLQSNDRIHFSQNDLTRLEFIIGMSDWCNAQRVFSIHSVDRVMALKFTCNQFLQHLVMEKRVVKQSDQRDLLGFTKMEGSSYRCFFEIYSKFKRGRR